MDTEEFSRYLGGVKRQCEGRARQNRKYGVIAYRAFMDRQLRTKAFTPEQREQILDAVAVMVETFNDRQAEAIPEGRARTLALVYSRNVEGGQMTPKGEWSRRKDERWNRTPEGWYSVHGLTVTHDTIGPEISAELERVKDTGKQLRQAVEKRRAALRKGNAITEGFRQWAEWVCETIDNMVKREQAEALKRAAKEAERPLERQMETTPD